MPIFDSDATVAIFRYSLGIPRIINLLCEHCLVSAFVDQKKTVSAEVVDSVARDFDLSDGKRRRSHDRTGSSVIGKV